ncbi:hypothetical protein [Pseudarthrobacter scleromae]|uniref:Uncharacterized protein n=1 Tax=Pseudarthrobacter scleromae TaxID=158897 RepID=A0ABQ2CDD9_9MICC|nr:hypothetical protein [Pseudarthrobacter scleromae]GGI80474.1 hypothetical protein GCM10007175_17140 [Pseudarthrobacter scleromae]
MRTGGLLYADAGHGLALVVAPDGSYRPMQGKRLPPVWAAPAAEDAKWHQRLAQLVDFRAEGKGLRLLGLSSEGPDYVRRS